MRAKHLLKVTSHAVTENPGCGDGRLPSRFYRLPGLERRPGNLHFGGFHDLDDLLTRTCPACQRGMGFLQWGPRLFRQEADVGLVLQQTGLDSTDAVVQRLFRARGVLQIGVVRIDHAGAVVRGPHFVKFVQLHPVEIILSFRVVLLYAFWWTFAPFLLQFFPLNRILLSHIFPWILWQKSAGFDILDENARTPLDKVMKIHEYCGIFCNLALVGHNRSRVFVQLKLSAFLELFDKFSTAPYLTLGTSSSSNMRVGLSDPP